MKMLCEKLSRDGICCDPCFHETLMCFQSLSITQHPVKQCLTIEDL